MIFFASSVLDEVTNYQEVLLYAATATAVVAGATVAVSSLRNNKRKRPPRVNGWPVVGSTLEFGSDCRSFLKKYFSKFRTPIFTTKIMGKDFHFVDTSYVGFSPEIIFRPPELSFRPISNDAAIYGFGFHHDMVNAMNGRDGEAKEVNALFRMHMLKSAGLCELMAQAYVQFERIVFPDPSLYPSVEENSSTKPLFWLVKESLFRATIGSVISDSIVAEDPTTSLKAFEDYDEKFPLLMSKVPIWMFSKAARGRQTLIEKCKGKGFYAGLSKLLRERNELVAQEKFGITSEDDIAMLTQGIVWAAAANTMPAGFWLLYSLLRNKETAYVAIQKEIKDFYRHRTKSFGAPLTVEEIDTMKGLDSALTETFRIYSESLMARDVIKDFELDLKIAGDSSSSPPSSSTSTTRQQHKYFLKKGSRMAVMMSSLHMDESVFENAQEYQWDRFLPDPATGKPQKFTKNGKTIAVPVRPFGGGSTICPGRKFAAYEIKAYVVELLKRYDLELVEDPGAKPLPMDPMRAGLGMNAPLGDVDVRITKSTDILDAPNK